METIALDFDGVLHNYTTWDGETPTNPPINGAQQFVTDIQNMGYNVVIVSTRAQSEGGKQGIINWLKENGFPALEVFYEKVAAEAYIDDRGFRFQGDFGKALQFIDDGLRPWYK